MRRIALIFLLIILLIVAAGLIFGFSRTRKSEKGANQKLFLTGHIPDPLPDGFYQGSVTGYTGPWQGKSFNIRTAEGINIFKQDNKESKAYAFRTYAAKGLRDRALDVYRIDYNIPSNPFWLRLVTDEVVELEAGKYLGKMQVQPLPGLVFTIGYFRLAK